MKKKRILIILIFITIALICLGNLIYNNILEFVYKRDYSEYVEKYSDMYNVDEKLIYAIIKNESNFKTDAVSSVGAIGLMQIMESTAEDVAKELEIEEYNLYSPNDNIQIGTKYFSYLLQKYEEPSLALAAYNAGFGNVDDWLEKGIIKSDGTDYENIPYKETNMYVRKILRDYEIYISKFS